MTPDLSLSPFSRAAAVVLVVHGGSGAILRQNMTAAREQEYENALADALRAGYAVWQAGGPAADAVEAALVLLEDCPLFNAGRGSVFTHEGRNEMDASVMDGRTRAAGAVAGVTVAKNPIRAARAVMERSGHVLLAGTGADDFARAHDVELADPAYFFTDARWRALQMALRHESEHGNGAAGTPEAFARLSESEESEPGNPPKLGTVGAVARDQNGNLAAGTSTGGMTNKRWGRIGDSPLIGAGTWADNRTCAVSATGHGEFFIRHAVAHDIHARMMYGALSVGEAAARLIAELETAGGAGGVIALDAHGNAALPFNTPGMYRGVITSDGQITVAIYRQ